MAIIKTLKGDITKISDIQAIVNAANAGCYYNSMQLAQEHGIRSIAFPSISTGVYSYPVELAAKVAVRTVSRFLEDNPDSFDLVEWVLFDSVTESIYEVCNECYHNTLE